MNAIPLCHPERSEGSIRAQLESREWSSPEEVAAEVTRPIGGVAAHSSLLTSAATSDDSGSTPDDGLRGSRPKGGAR